MATSEEMATGVTGKKQIGLLRLPAEIRIAIYELVVIEAGTIHIKRSTKPRRINRSEGLEFWAVVDLYDIVLPSLASVSRQLRNEALSVYFDINKFKFDALGSTGPGNIVRISNFPTFFQFVKKIEIRSFLSSYKWYDFALDFNTEQRGPKVTIDLSQCSRDWGANSTESEKFAAKIHKSIERAMSTQSSKDTIEKNIVCHVLLATSL